jgi:hypothetical protein
MFQDHFTGGEAAKMRGCDGLRLVASSPQIVTLEALGVKHAYGD